MLDGAASASASAAMANKLIGVGNITILVGWLSDATTIALVGLAVTVLGGVLSVSTWRQRRRDMQEKRIEEKEEHEARMRLIQIEIDRACDCRGGAQ